MSKSFVKSLIKERINKIKTSTDKIIDIYHWEESCDLFSGYFFKVLTLSENHNVTRYTGFISDDFEFDDIEIECF